MVAAIYTIIPLRPRFGAVEPQGSQLAYVALCSLVLASQALCARVAVMSPPTDTALPL
jgi:hypothetical protein